MKRKQAKLALLEKFLAHPEQVVDGLGKPIDPLIKPVVISLWRAGIVTRASCEGHSDWGCPFPWLAVHPTSIDAMQKILDRVPFKKGHRLIIGDPVYSSKADGTIAYYCINCSCIDDDNDHDPALWGKINTHRTQMLNLAHYCDGLKKFSLIDYTKDGKKK